MPFSADSVSPSRAIRMVSVPPCTFRRSKTCSGRPRSKVNRLVTSTSALIGRRPIATSRSCNQRGDGPLRRPRSARPSTKTQARGSAISHRTGEAKAAGTGAGAKGFKRPEPRRRQVARHAAHGQRVAPVRRDADLDHRIVEPRPGGVGRPERRILRQVHDARVVVAEPHLARGKQHPLARHAAYLALLERDPGARDEGARQGEHALHARPRIGRAADHGQHAPVARLHLAAPAAGRHSGAAPPRAPARCGRAPAPRRGPPRPPPPARWPKACR